MDWEAVQTILNYVSGPLVGAIIGYITNFIAVKMLFHPYEPIKLFGFTLPFTPGIIPRRKPKLAKAIARAVGNELFTESDLKTVLCSDSIKATVTDAICTRAEELITKSPKEIALGITTEEGACKVKDKVCALITDKVMESAREIDMGAIIAERGAEVIKEKKSSMGMFGMFITDELVSSLLDQLKNKVNEYIDTEGEQMICDKARDKIDIIFDAPLSEAVSLESVDRDAIREKLGTVYEQVVTHALNAVKGNIDIASIVEKKVNDMSVKELETLCMSVMKKELGAVINLGALIGFIIGIINIFV